MSHRITNKELRALFKRYEDDLIAEMLSSLPSDEEIVKIQVPPKFDRRMEQLIAD